VLTGAVASAAAGGGDLDFQLGYGPVKGRRRQVLAACLDVRFEDVPPVRKFHFEKGRQSFAGSWWLASTGELVGYESWLERDHVMLMDFDPEVAAVASQPFWLHWREEGGRARRHAPDFFVRRADGSALVVDVRPDERIEPRDAGAFGATRRMCALAGWGFTRAGAVDPVLAANVRWLSRYRHRRCEPPAEAAAQMAGVSGDGLALFEGADRAGGRLAVLPAVYHLLWKGWLSAELPGRPLGPRSLVRTGTLR
jgi:hypothetical protein